jgi:maltooligosyltrehalose trehalohydrolase
MGQEWATTVPFLYFTDHPEPLGSLVTEGRRKEFQHFSAFRDPAVRNQIPDPQDSETFTRCRLPWDEIAEEPHASILRLCATLLTLRRNEPALRFAQLDSFKAFALTEATLLIRQDADAGPSLLVVIAMRGSDVVDLAGHPCLEGLLSDRCQTVLTTEDHPFAPEPMPPIVNLSGEAPIIRFARPSAVLLRVWPRARLA